MFPRTQLFRLLDRARKRPVVWVAGPPGSGKTSLVASWVEARRLRAAWYQLDEGDADVATFVHYLGLAAAPAGPARRRPLPVLTPEHWSAIPAFARRYFQALFARLRPPFVLVLDNYQDVPAHAPLHDLLRDGLGELPPGGRVVVLSRSDPPPSLARLRASRDLEVLGWDVLRLTVEEARAIARLHGERRLTADVLRRLHEGTEGWAAGLVLTLERARTADAARRSLGEHTPDAVFDYFAGEIFQRANPQTQRFLLETAFLPSMTAPLAAALTGVRAADRILADLHQRHYFTDRRAEAEPVYQYHALFRLFLLSRGKETFDPVARVDLQRRAAALLAEAGQVEAAVGLLREAGDWDGLVRAILGAAPTLAVQGRSLTLEEWIGSVPSDVREQNAWLQYWLGICRTPFAPAQARPHLERAFEGFRRERDATGAFSAWCGAVGTILYEWDDFAPLDRWIDLLDELAGEHHGFPSPSTETRVASTLFGALMFRQPHHPEIAAWAERAFTLSAGIREVNRRMLTGFMLTTYHLWIGDRARATLVVDSLRPLARSEDASPLVLLTWRVVEAYQLWHEAELDPCLATVADGLRLAQATGIHLWDSELYGQGAYAALSAGDLAAARSFLEKKAAAMDHSRRLDVSQYHYLAGWEAMLRGDLARAFESTAAALRLATAAGTPFLEALNHLAMAQVRHERGESRPAADHLARARTLGRRIGSRLLEFMCFTVEAHLASEEAVGLAALTEAMALGRAHGYVSLDWWRPGVMAKLCERALAAGIEPEYVRGLVRRRGLVPDRPPIELERWPWPLRVYTLGEFRILRDDARMSFSGKAQQRPLAMLKAVIALGGQGVAEDQVADLLWPEAESDAAHQAFATTLHRLRALLGHERALALREGRLSLDPRLVWVDAAGFERTLDEADRAEQAGARDRARGLAEQALALYRGPFLAGDTREAWVISPRERLRRRFLRGVSRLARWCEDAGDWRAAVEWYDRGLDVDDLAEELYRGLMASHQRLGRRAEALLVFERCRAALAATLGVEPSPETLALHRSVRA